MPAAIEAAGWPEAAMADGDCKGWRNCIQGESSSEERKGCRPLERLERADRKAGLAPVHTTGGLHRVPVEGHHRPFLVEGHHRGFQWGQERHKLAEERRKAGKDHLGSCTPY
jgi:hypothetical protein